jgi:hypothetical protein
MLINSRNLPSKGCLGRLAHCNNFCSKQIAIQGCFDAADAAEPPMNAIATTAAVAASNVSLISFISGLLSGGRPPVFEFGLDILSG